MEKVTLDGKEFEVVNRNQSTDGKTTQETVTLRRVEKPRQDIRDYCKEHRVWATRDNDGFWAAWRKKPSPDYATRTWPGGDNIFIVGTVTLFKKGAFTFPDCPWDKSLIAPDGSMPLMEPKKARIKFAIESSWGVAPKNPPTLKKPFPRRGDPIFVWNDSCDERIPACVAYFHSITERAQVLVYDRFRYGHDGSVWDHYRPFDASLVGVPRKDWPEAK